MCFCNAFYDHSSSIRSLSFEKENRNNRIRSLIIILKYEAKDLRNSFFRIFIRTVFFIELFLVPRFIHSIMIVFKEILSGVLRYIKCA